MIQSVGLLGLLAGLSATPAAATPAATGSNTTPTMSVSALPPSAVEEVLSGVPINDVPATELSELLSQLPGLSVLPTASLQEALTKAITNLAAQGGTLGQLANSGELVSELEGQLNSLLPLPELLALLKGQDLTTILASALSSVNPSQLLNGLLTSAEKPEQLIEQVLAAPGTETLATLLGTTLAGEPFSKSTVGELASQAGTTPQGLAEDLNTTSSQMPASAMVLTAPLTNGKTLSVLDGLEHLNLGLLESTSGKTPGGSGGGAGGSGAGGVSGGSGSGTPGTPSSTTVVMNAYTPQGTSTGSRTAALRSSIVILSRRVKGNTVTVLVRVPGAGRLYLAGKGLRSLSEETARAERVTLRTTLTKAGAAALHRHRRHLKVKLTASFKQVAGPSSSAATTITFS